MQFVRCSKCWRMLVSWMVFALLATFARAQYYYGKEEPRDENYFYNTDVDTIMPTSVLAHQEYEPDTLRRLSRVTVSVFRTLNQKELADVKEAVNMLMQNREVDDQFLSDAGSDPYTHEVKTDLDASLSSEANNILLEILDKLEATDPSNTPVKPSRSSTRFTATLTRSRVAGAMGPRGRPTTAPPRWTARYLTLRPDYYTYEYSTDSISPSSVVLLNEYGEETETTDDTEATAPAPARRKAQAGGGRLLAQQSNNDPVSSGVEYLYYDQLRQRPGNTRPQTTPRSTRADSTTTTTKPSTTTTTKPSTTTTTKPSTTTTTKQKNKDSDTTKPSTTTRSRRRKSKSTKKKRRKTTRRFTYTTTTTKSRRRKTRIRSTSTTTISTTTTTSTTKPVIDILKLIELITNLTKEFSMNMTNKVNETMQEVANFTCPMPTTETPTTTTETPTTTPDPYGNLTGTIMGKCFVCGLDEVAMPRHARCADAFAGDFIPLVPVDATARKKLAEYRKYCRWMNVPKYVIKDTDPRSMWGRWTGGCSVRWVDISGIYTQRTCRNRHRAVMGKHWASKRMAKLEMALQRMEKGCIISPMASLVPLSRGISLYARFHACVCTGSWCNRASPGAQCTAPVVVTSLFLLLFMVII